MANKHTNYDLAQMQSLPLSAKVQMTRQRIRGWYDHFDGNVYVSVSGGKDSQVLAHIVKSMYDDVPCVYVRTGLEFSSVDAKGTELADEILRPSMDFVNVIKKYGYPIISKEVSECVDQARKYAENLTDRQTDRQTDLTTILTESCLELESIPIRIAKVMGMLTKDNKIKANIPNTDRSMYSLEKYQYLINAPFRISNKCCAVMKKKPTKKYARETDRKPIVGTMAEESRLRKQQWIRNGCNGFDMKAPISNPISFWTEQDILQYIKQNNLQIADIYGDIVYTDEDGMYYDNELFNDCMPLTTTGAKRTGCVFCMFGITQDTDRFLKLKEAEPMKYDFVMRGGKFDEEGMWIPHNGLGYKFVIDWINENGNLNIKY